MNSFTYSPGSVSDSAVKHIGTEHAVGCTDNDTTDLILTLYREEEISEYAARMLLNGETINRYNDTLKEASRMVGHQRGREEMAEWPDDVPMPYGHIPKEEYYVEGHARR